MSQLHFLPTRPISANSSQAKINAGNTRRQRGAALILTLVAVAIMGILAASIAKLVLGHLQSASTAQDAAKALDLAEAAVNFQVQKIRESLQQPNGVWEPSQGVYHDTAVYGTTPADFIAYKRGNPGFAYSVSDFIRANEKRDPYMALLYLALGENSSCEAWITPEKINKSDQSNQFIFGRGTVNGITRTVRTSFFTIGIFDEWTAFGIQTLTLNGPVNIGGSVGTNDTLKTSGGASEDRVTSRKSNPVRWPTVSQIANIAASYIQWYMGSGVATSSQVPASYEGLHTNLGIKNFAGTNNDNDSAQRLNAGGVTDNTIAFPSDGNIPHGVTVELVGKAYGANYYMTGLECGGSSRGELAVDVKNGPVTLWIDRSDSDPLNAFKPKKSDNDKIAGNITVKGDITNFHIYYSNRWPDQKLEIVPASGVTIQAMIYAYDNIESRYFGSVTVTGSVAMTGSIIAKILEIGPGVGVAGVSTTVGASVGEGVMDFMAQTPWMEYDPVRDSK